MYLLITIVSHCSILIGIVHSGGYISRKEIMNMVVHIF